MSYIIPVILCGGSGTRLWPASRSWRPKQFLPLIDGNSLLQNTASRAMRVSGAVASHIVTITLEGFAAEVEEQLSAIDPDAVNHILHEPSARSTAAAIAFAASYIARVFGKDAFMWVLPADHHMGDEEHLAHALHHARQAAQSGKLVTFGIKATRPETGYGYIRHGAKMEGSAACTIDAFVEKPTPEKAKEYIDSKNYLWNSGMFLFRVDVLLEEYALHAKAILKQVQAAVDGTKKHGCVEPALYNAVQETSFDIAIMEKTTRGAVVPCDPAWSDIGTWESLWEIRLKDANGNAAEGNVICHDTQDCLIQGQTRLIACAGLKNLVIIDTGDTILIADRSDSNSLRALVKTLKTKNRPEVCSEENVKIHAERKTA
jgi:mannose-1-phosphate guanylyltransferase/mannose-6-phosphate isomerase